MVVEEIAVEVVIGATAAESPSISLSLWAHEQLGDTIVASIVPLLVVKVGAIEVLLLLVVIVVVVDVVVVVFNHFKRDCDMMSSI